MLALGYGAGLRGVELGVWAAAIAVIMLVILMRSVRELTRPGPWYAGWLGGAMLVCVGISTGPGSAGWRWPSSAASSGALSSP